MADAILAHEVILGSGLRSADQNFLKDAVIGECQEHRLDVGVVDLDMVHAVSLFLATGKFMFLDASLEVVIHAGTDNESVLGAAVHRLCIDVVALLVVLYKPTLLLELLEVLDGLVIDLGLVFASARLEVDFRLDDVIQTHLVVTGLGTCLFTRQHIVGLGCYFFYILFRRSNATGRFYFSHDKLTVLKVLNRFFIKSITF